MIKYYDLFIIGGIFTSLIASILLFVRCRYHRHANRLLGTVLFATSWYGVLYLLIITGWIKEMPHLYRIGSPLYYLIPPCFYLYVRSILKDEAAFRKYDWLHAIPALVNVIDLVPFYAADTVVKQQIVNQISSDFNSSYQEGSGFIPAFWHFQLRWIQGVVYLAITWAIMLRSNNARWLTAPVFRKIGIWILAFTFFLTLIYAGLGMMGIRAIYGDNHISLLKTSSGSMLIQSLGFFGLSIYLFFRPEILYGPAGLHFAGNIPDLPIVKLANRAEDAMLKVSSPERDPLLDEKVVCSYIQRLEDALTNNELFRKHGISVSELARLLKLSPRNLSYAINQTYGQRFTDLINKYRVEYIKKRLDVPSWQELTLEGLANEAGFSSRSAFFAAFKKFTGQNPTEYLSRQKVA